MKMTRFEGPGARPFPLPILSLIGAKFLQSYQSRALIQAYERRNGLSGDVFDIADTAILDICARNLVLSSVSDLQDP